MTKESEVAPNEAGRVAPDATLSEIADVFSRDGYVLLPGLIQPAELDALRADTGEIIDGGWANKQNPTDYMHDVLKDTGQDVFHRVQYVFNKARRNSLLILLGQPRVLEIVHHLLGDDFVCAAEALVFKMPGNGREVSVHADCEASDSRLSPLIFNVDYYLDDATLENGCLWAAPGTHKLNLPQQKIVAAGFDYPGLVPVPARAGDVLLHNVRVVHGSHRSRGGALRRTLYYEFQKMSAMVTQNGPRPDFPMTDAFIRDRFRLLMAAIDARKAAPYAHGETPYPYQLPAGHEGIPRPTESDPANLRPALGYNKYI